MRRHLRALVVTLRRALRGEPPPHADLYAWMDGTLALVTAVEKAASAAGLETGAVRVRVDGHDDSMALALSVIAYHARTEYPYALRHASPHALMMIQASNFNDQYRTERLLDAPDSAPVRGPLAALHRHLGAFPAQNSHSERAE